MYYLAHVNHLMISVKHAVESPVFWIPDGCPLVDTQARHIAISVSCGRICTFTDNLKGALHNNLSQFTFSLVQYEQILMQYEKWDLQHFSRLPIKACGLECFSTVDCPVKDWGVRGSPKWFDLMHVLLSSALCQCLSLPR